MNQEAQVIMIIVSLITIMYKGVIQNRVKKRKVKTRRWAVAGDSAVRAREQGELRGRAQRLVPHGGKRSPRRRPERRRQRGARADGRRAAACLGIAPAAVDCVAARCVSARKSTGRCGLPFASLDCLRGLSELSEIAK